MGVEPGAARPDFEVPGAGGQAAVAEVALVAEELLGGAAVGDDGERYAEVAGAVVEEAVEVVVFLPDVSEEQDEVAGSVPFGDALGGGPAADTARVLHDVQSHGATTGVSGAAG